MLNSNAQKIFLVDDSYPGINGTDPVRLAVFNNKLYYIGTDAEHGGELWEYDWTVGRNGGCCGLTASLYKAATK